MKKRANALLLLFSISMGLVCVAFSEAQAQMQDVTFNLEYMFHGGHVPFYAALEKGFYKEVGLNVTIVRGFGSGDTIKKVAAKRAPIGSCDFGSLITSVIQEKTPIKAVSAYYGKALVGIIYLKESGIKGPKDLEGKTIGHTAGGASTTMLPYFLKINNVDRSKINTVIADATAHLPMLLSKKVDAILEQSLHVGRFQNAANEGGQKVTVAHMAYADYGVDCYGNVIIASDDVIEKDPALVRKFVQASIKGMMYAMDHPEEAVAALVKKVPEVTQQSMLDGYLVTKATWTEALRKTGVGVMTPERVRISMDSVVSSLGLEKPKSIDIFYTSKFVK